MAKYTFEQLKDTYTPLWQAAKVTKVAAAKSQAQLVLKHKDVFKETERRTKVPWFVVGIIHLREAGPQDFGVWKRVIHNGERIIGTGRKTKIVPPNRGPFSNWQDASYDALVTVKGFNRITDWSVERIAYIFETYNGFGYRQKRINIPSPYLWGGTSVQKRGKYVRDGVYDPNVMDSQVGTMAVLKELMKLDPTVLGKVPVAETTTAGGAVAGGAVIASQTDPMYWPYIILGTIVAIIVGVTVVRWYKKRQAALALAEAQNKIVVKQTRKGKKNG